MKKRKRQRRKWRKEEEDKDEEDKEDIGDRGGGVIEEEVMKLARKEHNATSSCCYEASCSKGAMFQKAVTLYDLDAVRLRIVSTYLAELCEAALRARRPNKLSA